MDDRWSKIFIFVVFLTSAKIHCNNVNVTFIQDAVAKGAVCLDGSPGAYFHDKGFGEGVDNWIVFLPGGGWCDNTESCLSRSTGDFGTNKYITSAHFESFLSPSKDINPDFYNWNKVKIRYCDGASFMSDVESVDPKTSLHLRGARIFRATMEELLAKGMSDATEAMLIGHSAGGLATILNCDRFHSFLPNAHRVKCVADSGFFILAKDLPGVEQREASYGRVVEFHELASALPKSCTSKMDPGLCFFPENVIGDIQTPLFLLNSVFDWYQLGVNLKPRSGSVKEWKSCAYNISKCTTIQLEQIKDFGSTFLDTVTKIPDNPSRGIFINTCHIHDFIYKTKNWLETPIIENKTISKAIGDWFFDRSNVRLIDTQNDRPTNCGP